MSFRCCVWHQLVVCVRVSAGCSADVDVNVGQPSCSSKRMRRRFVVATGSPAARRAAIPHSHLPAGIVVTMCRVVNYHSSWARQQRVELFDASGNPGSTAGRGFKPAGGAPGGVHLERGSVIGSIALLSFGPELVARAVGRELGYSVLHGVPELLCAKMLKLLCVSCVAALFNCVRCCACGCEMYRLAIYSIGRASSYRAPLLPAVGWFSAMRRVDSYHALISLGTSGLSCSCFWYHVLRRLDSYHALTCSVTNIVCISSRGVFLRALYLRLLICSCDLCTSSCGVFL
ncbi:xanthine/uracil/vitamin C permease [Dorcoceras hygrometricum]|uniref:Xanthine/uracil/vitamin C permease n=1 Tax=Dorcoceras hygrometricum TaxID=472368 RepID=A0A2Z7CDY6_9LAMI|nr:xanthine/uracil/vitamin C permease [Dorcoceras hygrometricum]